jgi:ATP-dependent RNA helicase DeaD
MRIIELPVSDEMKQTLTKIGFVDATPIQEKAIPLALEGNDIIGQAQTGTGKTAGFSVPIIEQMEANKTLQTLILVPTRELALQVSDAFMQMSQHKKLRVAIVFGGASIEQQIRNLKRGYEVVVATPGRCIDLMKRRVLKTDDIRFLVLDEVDEMLSMGFIDDIETIAEKITHDHQTLFFSATMTKKIQEVAQKFLHNPKYIKIEPSRKNLEQINQSYLILRDNQKTHILSALLHIHNPEKAIIFARTKRRVDDVADELLQQGFAVDRIHGDLSQEQRTFNFKKFRNGQTRLLVATDVAARGLDIKELSHVYNYDLPQELEYYVHRIGRTGRADAYGEAISFFTPAETRKLLTQIERKTKSTLTKAPHPTADEVIAAIEQKAATDIVANIQNVHDKTYFNAAKALTDEYNATQLLASALMLLAPTFDKEAFIKRSQKYGQSRPERPHGAHRGRNRNDRNGEFRDRDHRRRNARKSRSNSHYDERRRNDRRPNNKKRYED